MAAAEDSFSTLDLETDGTKSFNSDDLNSDQSISASKNISATAEVSEPSTAELFLASIGLQPIDSVKDQKESPKVKSSKSTRMLPTGWRKICVRRQFGKSAGKFDAYIFSPDGRKHRSKTELAAYLEKKGIANQFNMDDFDFTVRSKDATADGDDESTPASLPVKKTKRPRTDEKASPSKARRKSLPVKSVKRKLNVKRKSSFSPSPRKVANFSPLRKRPHVPRKLMTVKLKFAVPTKKEKRSKTTSEDEEPTNESDGCSMSPDYATDSQNQSNASLMTIESSLNYVSCDNIKNKFAESIVVSDDDRDDVSCYHRDVSMANEEASVVTRHKKPELNNNSQTSSSSCDVTENCTFKPQKSHLHHHHTSFSIHKNSPAVADVVSGDKKDRSSSWVPPQSPFNLAEESLFGDPWKVLVASMFIDSPEYSTNKDQPKKTLREFFRLCPTVESTKTCNWLLISKKLQKLRVSDGTVNRICRFSEEYRKLNWSNPTKLHGIGKYGCDSYRIFCVNEWKEVAPDHPKLNEYHHWLWLNHRHLGIG